MRVLIVSRICVSYPRKKRHGGSIHDRNGGTPTYEDVYVYGGTRTPFGKGGGLWPANVRITWLLW